LGSASLTPLEVARGYTVFANGGFLVEPYFITRVEDASGTVLYQAEPARACPECEPVIAAETVSTPATAAAVGPRFAARVVEARTAYLTTSMMQDVIRHGTGKQALALGRDDLAGKTGTTNEQRDAWFCGFNHAIVTTAWVGFDTPRPLGNLETGARAALPMWIDYMAEALRGVPQQPLQPPAGMVTVRIDAETGEFTTASNPNAIFEVFRSEDVPEQATNPGSGGTTPRTGNNGNISEQLF